MTNYDIVFENEWLIKKIAKKFYNVDYEDLYQAGALGIMKAFENYKDNGLSKFSTYAYDYIFGEMYSMVYKNQSIKLSKDILRTYQKIEMTRSTLAQKLNKIPSYDEVAIFLEMDPVIVSQIVVSGSYLMMSLDDKANEEDRSFYETIPNPEGLSLEEQMTLHDGISTLNHDEQKIIQYRYFEDLTQSETAQKLHMTQAMVSRYEKKGMRKIRSYYDGIAV